ncbi:ribose 5-phosphate isomerase B [Candidatus Bipolaricaulota bacterium]|nr:ribose 5-phosphate isomerase B [Candidatus Bipolaricaulota bacterium]MCK4598365.1 ribose 5-phosphate isomerase B [Candidatus Bipolaricaulota bacterium]
MKVAIGCDHTGVALKRALIKRVLVGYTIIDLGTDLPEPVDYPDIAKRVSSAIAAGEAKRGILICGTGIGMAMAAGKMAGIRAATCMEPYSAEMSRRHNDANILCLGARVIGVEMAEKITETWLTTPFEGGKHARRVDKIG